MDKKFLAGAILILASLVGGCSPAEGPTWLITGANGHLNVIGPNGVVYIRDFPPNGEDNLISVNELSITNDLTAKWPLALGCGTLSGNNQFCIIVDSRGTLFIGPAQYKTEPSHNMWQQSDGGPLAGNYPFSVGCVGERCYAITRDGVSYVITPRFDGANWSASHDNAGIVK